MSDNADLVIAFCRAWSNRDVDEILGYFTEDAVYHNMPMPPMQGRPARPPRRRRVALPAGRQV